METPGDRSRRYLEFPELALNALRFLVQDVEPTFQQIKYYTGASKYKIGRAVGHTQHLDTVNEIIQFLLDQKWVRISAVKERATYYRATPEGVAYIGNYYMTFNDLFERARQSRTKSRRRR